MNNVLAGNVALDAAISPELRRAITDAMLWDRELRPTALRLRDALAATPEAASPPPPWPGSGASVEDDQNVRTIEISRHPDTPAPPSD